MQPPISIAETCVSPIARCPLPVAIRACLPCSISTREKLGAITGFGNTFDHPVGIPPMSPLEKLPFPIRLFRRSALICLYNLLFSYICYLGLVSQHGSAGNKLDLTSSIPRSHRSRFKKILTFVYPTSLSVSRASSKLAATRYGW